MKKYIIGFLVAFFIIVGVNAFGKSPYDDTKVIKDIKKLSRSVENNKAIIKAQHKVIIDQKNEIKYLKDILGKHQEVISDNYENIDNILNTDVIVFNKKTGEIL